MKQHFYMVKRGAHWVKDPALANTGFPYLSFRTKQAAEVWCFDNPNKTHQIARVRVRLDGLWV